jgi:hypothetical protein
VLVDDEDDVGAFKEFKLQEKAEAPEPEKQ